MRDARSGNFVERSYARYSIDRAWGVPGAVGIGIE
jgi:hypothetical protein